MACRQYHSGSPSTEALAPALIGLAQVVVADEPDRARELVAEGAAADGDADAATRYHLRILERDACDEAAHVGLVRALLAAGRHGEARRRYGLYADRMEEMAVEAAPFPSVRATSATVPHGSATGRAASAQGVAQTRGRAHTRRRR